jgi:hypothetical protein
MARICRQAGCARDRGGNDAAVGEGGGAKGMKPSTTPQAYLAIHQIFELAKAEKYHKTLELNAIKAARKKRILAEQSKNVLGSTRNSRER